MWGNSSKMNQSKCSPKISVITPSFNQGQFLERTILSVLNQNYPNLEHIIIDGGSTDNSVDIIKKYERSLTYWVSEKDRGQSHAFNKGLRIAKGEIIGWINSDDLYLNQCLFQTAEYFDKHPSVDIVFSDYYYINENDNILRRRKEIPFNYAVYLWSGDCYHANCAGFFRHRVFDTVGGLDESLNYGMDYELYLRASSANLRIGHKRAYWGAYRLHGQSKSISAHDLQKQDSKVILTRFCPPGTSRFGAWWRRNLLKLKRIGWKFLIGSYFPSYKTSKTAPNE